MCGICGFYKVKSNKYISSDYIRNMCNVMSHRGPDGEGVWTDDTNICGLGHRRLSIIDLSDKASQPMTNITQDVVVSFNGEIYNYQEIKKKLLDKYIWMTDHSDTEVLLHAYEEWGIECIHHFRGMFAIAIFDKKLNKLWLIRDRIGIKPLYYYYNNGIFTFASEIKALLKVMDRVPSINKEGFYDYFSFSTTMGHKTMFDKIYKLEPATIMSIDVDTGINTKRYWDVLDNINSDIKYMTESEITGILLEEFRESVHMRTCSDVPVGTFLSGGIDSSFVTLLMPKTESKAKSFCVGYSRNMDSYASEYEYANIIANKANTQHISKLISESEAWENFEQIFYFQDEPLGEHAEIPTFFVSKLARENGVTVIETGDGADELFFGYPALKKYIQILKLRNMCGGDVILKGLTGVLNLMGKREGYIGDIIDRAQKGEPIYWEDTSLTRKQKRDFISNDLNGELGNYDSLSVILPTYKRYLKKMGDNTNYNWISYFSLCHRLPELLLTRVDKMSMANSIECRVPFLDHKFIEFAMSIPEDIKTKNYKSKYILKKAADGIIPSDLLWRKKQGFGSPVINWLNGQYRNDVFDIIKIFNDNTGLLNEQYIKEKKKEAFTWNDWYIFNAAYWWKIFYR